MSDEKLLKLADILAKRLLRNMVREERINAFIQEKGM